VPTGIPQRIVAGDTVVWDDPAVADPRGPFTSTDGWVLHYHFVAPSGRLSVTATTQGSGWRTTLSASQTSGLRSPTTTEPEAIRYTARVTKASESYSLPSLSGTLILDPDPATLGSYVSEYEQELAEVRAAIRAIQKGAQNYTIGDRSVTKADLSTLYARERVLIDAITRARYGGQPTVRLVQFDPAHPVPTTPVEALLGGLG
jgi:hypothetical protein